MNVIRFLLRFPFPLIILEEKCSYFLRKKYKQNKTRNAKKKKNPPPPKKERRKTKFLKGVDICEGKVRAPWIVGCPVFAGKFDWRLNGGKCWVFFSYLLGSHRALLWKNAIVGHHLAFCKLWQMIGSFLLSILLFVLLLRPHH